MTSDQELLATRVLNLIKQHISKAAHIDIADLEDDVVLFPELAPDLGIDISAPGVTTNPNVSLDSLDILDILVEFEEAFGIQFELSDLQSQEVSPDQLATPRLITEFILRTVEPSDIEAALRADLSR
jgi:acyl carrier protein